MQSDRDSDLVAFVVFQSELDLGEGLLDCGVLGDFLVQTFPEGESGDVSGLLLTDVVGEEREFLCGQNDMVLLELLEMVHVDCEAL